MLANSSLGYDLASNSNLVPSGKHIVGDSAYPLYEQLMVPYRVASSLISYQANYNKRLSSTRIVIEHAFGLLKGRWRRLRCVDMSLESVPFVITACCVLHNLCQLNKEELEEWFDENDQFVRKDVTSSIAVGSTRSSNTVVAQQKHDRIARNLP